MNNITVFFQQPPIIGIIRGVSQKMLLPVLDTAVRAGLTTLEITLNTPSALELIHTAATHFQSTSVTIGAGTVCTRVEAEQAISAGARFIVSPITNVEMIAFCTHNNIPVFPGALSPTEVYTAWSAGATMVKVFPVGSVGGASYIRYLKGPFSEIPLLACGGVTPENMNDFFSAGASAITIGGNVFKTGWMEAGDLEAIFSAATAYFSPVARLTPVTVKEAKNVKRPSP